MATNRDFPDGPSNGTGPLLLGPIMQGRIDRDDQVVTLALAGEFDLTGVEAFTTTLEQIEAARPHAIAIDLQDLSFLDSTGIRALFAAHQRAAGVRLFAILTGQGPAHRTLSLAGLDDWFPIVDHPSELREQFG